MKEPGPDHPIAIAPHPKRVRVMLGGMIVAETTRALSLREASYPPVLYVPRADIEADLFEPTERRSHCPYKGDASYWTITAGGLTAKNAAWSYEAPFPAMAEIAGHVAFYPEKVDAIEELT